MNINIAMANLQVDFINDIGDVDLPIARFALEELHVKLASYRQKSTIRLSLALYASYFNNRLVKWEPMLEPWQLSIFMRSLPNQTMITLKSETLCNVNLTYAMVKSVFDTLELLTIDDEKERRIEKQKEQKLARQKSLYDKKVVQNVEKQPYFFSNDTEKQVTLLIDGGLKTEIIMVIQPWDTHGFS
eukprot:UN24486